MKVTIYYPDSLELSEFSLFLRLQEGADLHRGVVRSFLFDKERRKEDNKKKTELEYPKWRVREDEKGKTSGRSSFSGYRPAEKEESKESEVEISNKV